MAGGSVTHTQTTLLDKRIRVTLGREQGKSQSSSQLCYASYIYTFSLVSSSKIKLHNREIAIEVTGGARTPRQLYVPPTPPHTERGGLLKGTDMAVTTCRLPLQTVGIVEIQQLLANLD